MRTVAVFGKQLQCWQKGKRKGCIKNDPKYNLIEADLHNLMPVIGEVNGDRADFQYGWLPDQPTKYGQCQTVIDFKKRKMMPRKEVRALLRVLAYTCMTATILSYPNRIDNSLRLGIKPIL